MHDLTKLRVHQDKVHRSLLRQAQLCVERGTTIIINKEEKQQLDGDCFIEDVGSEEMQEYKTCEGGFLKGKKK